MPDEWPIMLVANASLPEQQALVGTLNDMPQRLADTSAAITLRDSGGQRGEYGGEQPR